MLTTQPTPAALGDPMTPPELTPPGTPVLSAKAAQAAQPTSGFPLSSVVAFILALCLSQLVLVFGGFTGEKGSANLEAVLHRLTSLFSASS